MSGFQIHSVVLKWKLTSFLMVESAAAVVGERPSRPFHRPPGWRSRWPRWVTGNEKTEGIDDGLFLPLSLSIYIYTHVYILYINWIVFIVHHLHHLHLLSSSSSHIIFSRRCIYIYMYIYIYIWYIPMIPSPMLPMAVILLNLIRDDIWLCRKNMMITFGISINVEKSLGFSEENDPRDY